MFDKYLKKPGDNKNITPKIFAIILAVVLWLYVMNEQNPPIESSFTIPLEVRNAATSYVVDDVPESVRIKVRGPRSIVAGVLTRDLKAYVDVKGLNEGRHSIKVAATLPSSLELVEINPDKVPLRIDSIVSRKVPVEARLAGAPIQGAKVGKITVANEQVTIEGPKNLVGTVEKIMAPVDLSGKSADIAAEPRLIPVNSQGKEVEGLTIYPEKTQVAVSLTVTAAKKMIDVRPVTQGQLPPGLVIKSIVTQPDKVEISETTPGKGTIDKLEAIYTEPVSLADVSKDINKESRLQLPEGVTGTPGTVMVSIKIGPR